MTEFRRVLFRSAREALAKVKERAGDEVFAAMPIEQLIKEGLGAVS